MAFVAVLSGLAATPLAAASTSAPRLSGWEMAAPRFAQVKAAVAAGHTVGSRQVSQAVPAGNISSNLEFLSNLQLPTAISIAFVKDVAFVSTVEGLFSVDISDPSSPKLLGALPMYIYENEHMQSDPKRNLVIISRDPRGFTTPATTDFPYGAMHIIDVSNPAVMVQLSFTLTPAGHTATCINDCQFLWIAGPRKAINQDASWGGRPIWPLDISDPRNPKECPNPHWLDLASNDGVTDYSHDVDVDAMGVAWVSGSGHIRGFWTSGSHLNPVSGKVETATACEPVPYAGGGTNEGQIAAPNSGVMHNSSRNLGIGVDGRLGDAVFGTEEVTVTDCSKSGRFVSYDIGQSFQGQGWINTAKTHFRLRKLDQWTPQNKPGSTGCDSAHWFQDRGDGLIAIAFYSQGTRLLDVRDPSHIRQVGYYNPSSTNTWAAYWHGKNEVVIADFTRGLDILRFKDASAAAQGTQATPGSVTPGRVPLPLTSTTTGGVLVVGLATLLAALLGLTGRRRPRRG